jgi:hypothetical protein
MSEVIEERWSFGCSLTVENPAVGRFINTGLYTGIELTHLQQNWLVCSVPAPNVLEAWKIKSIMIQYNIRNTQGDYGKVDKIGIRDGNQTVHGFENLDIGRNANWEIRKLALPTPWDYRFGIGVNIHVIYPEVLDPGPWPTQFLFTSIGLEFTKSADGPVIEPTPSKK